MDTTQGLGRCAVVGQGRLGSALVRALRDAGLTVDGPLGRGAAAHGADLVLLCVPDSEIAAASAAVAPREGLLVGHCSGLTGLDAVRPHEAFSLHPLMTVPREGAVLAGAGCAVAGATPRALAAAEALADALGMVAARIGDDDRAAYHAAASIASNFLVTLDDPAQLLSHVAVNYVKIDGSLMQGLANDRPLQERVKALVEQARERSIITIAERVEDANTMAVLWQLGIEFIQGYFVNSPEEVVLGN